MNLTKEDLLAKLAANPALLAANAANPALRILEIPAPTILLPIDKPRRMKRLDGYDSALEARYADEVLKPQQAAGIIKQWWYPAPKLFLAPKTTYTPDFMVEYADEGRPLEMHEVKGYWRPQARVKTKVAAQHYPCYRFVGLEHREGRWVEEVFPSW